MGVWRDVKHGCLTLQSQPRGRERRCTFFTSVQLQLNVLAHISKQDLRNHIESLITGCTRLPLPVHSGNPSTGASPSLDVMEDLMRDAVVLAHGQLFKLPPAIALAVGAHADAFDTGVVLLKPIRTARQATRFDLIQRVFVLLARLEVGRMVLREVQEELGAVGEAHGNDRRGWNHTLLMWGFGPSSCQERIVREGAGTPATGTHCCSSLRQLRHWRAEPDGKL